MNPFRNTALALAAAGLAVPAIPASAHDYDPSRSERSWQEGRDHLDRYGYDTRYYGPGYHSQPDYRDGRDWRTRDGREYCRRNDGTACR